MEIKSRVGTINYPAEQTFKFISNFENFKSFIPEGKIQDWQSTEDTCSFSVQGMASLKLKMIEKEPFSVVKIAEDGDSKYGFNFWVQLKEPQEGVTKFKLTLKAKLNPMMSMMVKKPLTEAIEKLVFALENANFNNM